MENCFEIFGNFQFRTVIMKLCIEQSNSISIRYFLYSLLFEDFESHQNTINIKYVSKKSGYSFFATTLSFIRPVPVPAKRKFVY